MSKDKIVFIKSKKVNEDLSRILLRNYCTFNDYECCLELEINNLKKEVNKIVKLLKKNKVEKLVFLDISDLGINEDVYIVLEKLCLKDIEVEVILQNIKTKRNSFSEVLNAIFNYNIINYSFGGVSHV